MLVAKLHGLYDRDDERADNSTVDDLVGVFHVVTIVVWVSLVMGLLTGFVSADPTQLVAFWAIAFAFATIARGVARAAGRRSSRYVQNTIIVGAGDDRPARGAQAVETSGIRAKRSSASWTVPRSRAGTTSTT